MKNLFFALFCILSLSACCELEVGDCINYKGNEWLVSEVDEDGIEISRTNSKGKHLELELDCCSCYNDKTIRCDEMSSN
jgi:hypothetical protein